ncbi:MAG: EF-hand domain-containing protein [Azonexus sp.]|nr:EF-hand domain-containing protein [Azonexus sp.]
MKFKTTIAPLFLLVALPLGAIAAEPTQPPSSGPAAKEAAPAPAPAAKDEPMPLFKELDTNRDNFVTKDEAKRSAEVLARFKELDTDRDGKISGAEFKKGMQPKY